MRRVIRRVAHRLTPPLWSPLLRLTSLPRSSAVALVFLNVGGHYFTTLRSILSNGSSYFAADSPLFVDADRLLFAYLLKFLRHGLPPLFWTRADGFDYPPVRRPPVPGRLLRQRTSCFLDLRPEVPARYYHSPPLEMVDLSTCYEPHGLRAYADNVTKCFDGIE